MNNTSESIYFGAPMICLPLSTAADQPLIAYRVADELGLGFRLNPKKLDTIQMMMIHTKKDVENTMEF